MEKINNLENIPKSNFPDSKITGPQAVRVRFAPSPTGFLHIGSARTAFFNWLFAKKNRGKFILRIEDTDITRHIEKSVKMIMDSLKWLSIFWDEGPDLGGNFGPYRQSQRKDIYIQYVNKLINEGKAYYCFCSPEKLKEKINKHKENKDRAYKYDRECFYLDEKKVKENVNKKEPFTVRFLVPHSQKISFIDTVYGSIEVRTDSIEDFILLRSNGIPTYNFSAVVDDILMEISHVIRGEDHLSNTPKQILIYDALGCNLPEFTHLPMILGPDGEKLSKRHGAISIEAYRDEGFLPEAIQNYLALMGWSYDEKTTIFHLRDLINKFGIDRINKKPSRFDYDKLLWLNGYYLRLAPEEKLVDLISKRLPRDYNKDGNLHNYLEKILPLIRKRMKTLKEASEKIHPFFNEITYSKDLIKLARDDEKNSIAVIENALKMLSNIECFEIKNIENALRQITETTGLDFKKIAGILRLAIWGDSVSPPIFETIEVLGRKKAIKRLKKFKDKL